MSTVDLYKPVIKKLAWVLNTSFISIEDKISYIQPKLWLKKNRYNKSPLIAMRKKYNTPMNIIHNNDNNACHRV